MKHQSRTRRMMLSSASAIAVCTMTLAAPAMAQTTTADDTVVEEVVVTARRAAIENAIAIKKNSDTMVDSVVAEEAGKLPDNSITEVLQRVSGVTMVRFAALGDPDQFSVEGSGIQVRGLSGITGMLNGREVFGANGGGGLSWGEVTPELMAGVDVYKANRADMIEGGLGGAINLRTKMPFDFRKPSVEGSVSVSYGNMIKKSSPSASVLLADRWDTPIGEIGLLVDVAYSEFFSQSSFIRSEPYFKRETAAGTRYIPRGFNYGDAHFNRTREGFYEALQWRPTDNLTVFQTFFQSKYKSENDGAGVFVGSSFIMPDPSRPAEFDANGFIVRADRLFQASPNDGTQANMQPWGANCNAPYGRQATSIVWGPNVCAPTRIGVGSNRNVSSGENTTRDFSQGFTWDVNDRLRIQGAAQFIDSSVRSRSFGMGLESSISAFSFNTLGKLPTFTIEDPAYLAGRGNYIWASVPYREVRNHAGMGAVNLDVDYVLGDGFFKEVSAGIRYADRSERDSSNGTFWAPTGRGWNSSPQRTLNNGAPGDADLYEFTNFFHGNTALPAPFYLPSTALLSSYDTIYAQKTYGFDNEQRRNAGGQLICAGPNSTAVVCGTLINPAVPAQGAYNTNLLNEPLPTVVNDLFGGAHTQVTTTAAYVQTKFGSDEGLLGVAFTGNFGIRVVKNEVLSTGFFRYNNTPFFLTQAEANAANNLVPNTLDTTGRARSDGIEYTKVLPSLNLNFKPSDQLFIRFAANRTMSPAGYNDIRATGFAGITTTSNANNVAAGPGGPAINYPGILAGFTSTTGNPKLRPAMSTNFDLAFEWYPVRGTNAHISMFHKKIDDLIVYGDTFKPFVASYINRAGQSVDLPTTVRSTEVFNAAEKATIKGVEFGFRKFFDELPGVLKGIGIESNYTYVDSKNPSALALDVNGLPMTGIPIVGLSKNAYNIVLMYEYKKLSTRLAYNWRGRYLQSTNANGTSGDSCYYPSIVVNTPCPANVAANTPANLTDFIDISLPVYGEAYGSLDFGFNYEVTKNVKLSFQASNLQNTTAKTVMGGYPNGAYPIRSWFQSDRRYSAGLNFTF